MSTEWLLFAHLRHGARFRFRHDPDRVWVKTGGREYQLAVPETKMVGTVMAPVEPVEEPPTTNGIAQELRCACTQKRCSEYGCSKPGAQDVGPDWRCPTCQAFEYLTSLPS